MEPLSGVIITSREIYDAVVRLTGRVDVLIEQQAQTRAENQDQETRLRTVERRVLALPSLATVCALAALAVSILGFMRGG